MTKLEEAGLNAYNQMTSSDKELFHFINSKIEECVKQEREAMDNGEYLKVGKITVSYFKLLGQAVKLGMKYPAA